MSLRLRLDVILLLLSLFYVANSAFTFDDLSTVSRFDFDSLRSHAGVGSCNGEVGDCFDNSEELEMLTANQIARRGLLDDNTTTSESAQRPPSRYISYMAMKANNVPCSQRGQSYYNCDSQRGTANPYTRGCSYITHCARYTE